VRAFLSVQEAADVLGVEHKTVRRLIRDGDLPAAKIRSVYRIKYDDLLAYFDAQKVACQGACASRSSTPGSMAPRTGHTDDPS
jgi:excisionase family DNA binding protein